MPSPIGHSILAFIVTGLRPGPYGRKRWWPALVIFAGCAADLDFLPGILMGDPNRFHHGPSHSITAALVFAITVAAFARALPLRWVVLTFFIYLSHLLGDWLAADTGAPFGIPLLWPFSSAYFISPVPIFSNFDHGGAGVGLADFIGQLFSLHNLLAIGLEIAVLGPVLWLVTRYRRRRSRR